MRLRGSLMRGRIRICHVRGGARFSTAFSGMGKCPKRLPRRVTCTVRALMAFGRLILCVTMILLCSSCRTYARSRSSTLAPQKKRTQLVE